MRCKNCKRSFGLDLEYGIENEPAGECIGCLVDLCLICARTPRIETREVIDPEEYSDQRLILCSSCVSKIAPAAMQRVA